MSAGFYISKNRCIIVVCLWVLITVLVGLLAGLIKSPCKDDGVMDNSIASSTGVANPTTTAKPFPPQGDGPWMNPFLPSYTHPVEYDLWLYPDFYFSGTTFQGSENVTIKFTQKSKYIIIHYKMMNITETRVFQENGKELDIVQTFAYDPHQYWITEVKEDIPPNSLVILQLKFEGSLVNGIVGYYKSTYINHDIGEESWLATTKFQPTDARKAFPNFDEPKYKANFSIALRHWKNFTALSNMPNNSYEVLDNIWAETHFDTTPIMSSYLVCFVVCDFVYRENTLASGIPHRIWTSTDKIEQVQYALRVGKEVADFFAQQFEMDFHLPKLDQVAVPDYISGATEHWGIITYREGRLLFDENEAGSADRQGVAEIVAHELAHNYFGNLVTCKWWDDIWLNEGFASYYGDMSLVDIEPEFEMKEHFVVTTTQSIMQSDANVGSRAIREDVTNPDEINQAFTGVVYSKGAAVLRMIENNIGKDKMYAALKKYLRKHAYSTAVTSDLWNALQEVVGDSIDITATFGPWIEQSGFPVVNIKSGENDQITVDQQVFLYDSISLDDKESKKWYIPLTYQSSSSNFESMWLNKTTANIPYSSNTQWIKFNHGQNGYYRVNYPTEMWKSIGNQLRNNLQVFSPIDRANILDDAFNLARASQLDFPTVLDLTVYMENETHYFPWSSTDLSLSYISIMLQNDGQYSLWRKYIQTITSPIMKKLQVKDEGTHLEILNRRNNIIPMACDHGHADCIENTTNLFLKWIENDTFYLSPNLRSFVYKYGMQHAGNEEIWDNVWQRYTVATGQEKTNLAYCLAWTNRILLIQRYLGYAMDPTKIKRQDFFSVVNYIAGNPNVNRYLWDWTRANYQALIDRFGISDRYFGRMVPNMVAMYNTEYQLQEVTSFYNKYPEAGAGFGPRLGSVFGIESNIVWMTKNRGAIAQWLDDNADKFN